MGDVNNKLKVLWCYISPEIGLNKIIYNLLLLPIKHNLQYKTSTDSKFNKLKQHKKIAK